MRGIIGRIKIVGGGLSKEYRLRDKIRKKKRYRDDPLYRAKVIETTLRSFQKKKSDRLYMKIVALRKKLWSERRKVELWLEKVEKVERKIRRLVKLKEKLENKKMVRDRKAG